MIRASLALSALIAAAACGQSERKPAAPTTGGGGQGGIGGSGPGGSDAGGVVSTGGSSPVAECQQFCETMQVRLPQALCEDWNEPGWEPPFCQLDPTASCADYCSQVYETVSTECAAVLAPVIRCVAPDYAKGVLTSCWLSDCRSLLYTLASTCYGLREKLAAARATWQASGVVEYDLTYTSDDGAKVRVAVRANEEPVAAPAGAYAWTVPMLFDAVEHDLQQPGGAPDVHYDASLGYVADLVFQVGCDVTYGRVSGIQVAPLR